MNGPHIRYKYTSVILSILRYGQMSEEHNGAPSHCDSETDIKLNIRQVLPDYPAKILSNFRSNGKNTKKYHL